MTVRGISLLFFLAVFAAAARAPADEPAAPEADAIKGTLLAPKAFRAAARKVLPCLVSIESFGGVPSAQGRIGEIRRQGDGPTTGVILSSDGYILTSTFNFITKPSVITIIFADGQRRVAELLGRDETRKICLLKVEGAGDLSVPDFAPRGEVRVGQWAVTVGVGFGDREPAISAGIISATNRIGGRAVQTDANTSPANYGGPLIDIDGRVIGICVPLSPRSKGAGAGVEWYDSGIGFAVPVHESESLLAALKQGKTVRPGYLGIQLKPADAKGGGAVVEKIQPNSPAAKAGVKTGDQILSIGGKKILDKAHLGLLVGRHIAGDTLDIAIQRGEQELTLKVTLASAPRTPQPSKAARPPAKKSP